jgi:predicted acetyltransferase
MKSIECWHLGQDEPLLYMVLEPRRLKFRLRDGLWIRVVDVPAALEGRQYAAPGAVRLEVRDEFCPWNNGRYELEAAPDGASCSKTDKDPDLVLTAADLGAVYLGGPTLAQLWRAGRVTERRAGAVAEASRLFAWDPQPWSSHIF